MQLPFFAIVATECERLRYRWETAAMSVTRSFLSLLAYFGLISLDADMYEYLR